MKTKTAYISMTVTYVLTLLILLLQTFAHPPENAESSTAMLLLGGVVIWLFKVLPLLFVIPGLIQQRQRTGSWLSFLSMLYFIFGVLLAFTAGAGLWGWLLSITSLVLFLSSMLYTRWKKAEPLTQS